MIRPPFAERANVVMLRSISSALRTPIGVNSTSNDGATAWIAAKPPEPAGTAGSRTTATRFTPGAISLSSSSHLPLMLNSKDAKSCDVGARSRQALDPAAADRIDRRHEHNRHGAACLLQRAHDRAGRSQDDIRRERDQLRGVSAKAIEIAGAPAILDPHVTADTPAQFGQRLRESRNVL